MEDAFQTPHVHSSKFEGFKKCGVCTYNKFGRNYFKKSRVYILFEIMSQIFNLPSPKLMKLFQFEAYLHLCHSFMLFWVMINFDFLAFNFLTLSENFLFLSSLFNDFQIDLLTKPSFSTVLINSFPLLSGILTRPIFFYSKLLFLFLRCVRG